MVCLELAVPHQVLVTPQQLSIADPGSGERGKALIAGLVPALCGYEDLGLALQTHAVPMADGSEDIKLVLCLTDGACNDAELGKAVCRGLQVHPGSAKPARRATWRGAAGAFRGAIIPDSQM